jgi:hypothetical protein
MFKRLFLVPTILSASLMLNGSAFAQHHGGGHGGGQGGGHAAVSHAAPHAVNRGAVNRGVTRGNRGYAGNYRGGNYGGRGYYGGYGRGYYGGYYGGYPGYYDGGYYDYGPTFYGYDYPDAGYDYNQPITAAPAQLHIYVPNPNATIWVNGVLDNRVGSYRPITTQLITSGTPFHVQASWMEGNRERAVEQTVVGTPGGTSVVDFRQ